MLIFIIAFPLIALFPLFHAISECKNRICIRNHFSALRAMMPVRIILFFLIFLSPGLFHTSHAATQLCVNSVPDSSQTLHVAALYRAGKYTYSTAHHLEAGLCESLEAMDLPFNVVVTSHKYKEPEDGIDKLLDILNGNIKPIPHLIIGPTDSDVFVSGIERSAIGVNHAIPVVSPIVTADYNLEDNSWFFQINPNVIIRAQLLVLLCHKISWALRRTATPTAATILKQHACMDSIKRFDRCSHMPFRPHWQSPSV